MFNQSISIIEFPKLYNILKEIDDLFEFNIKNFKNATQFIDEINANNFSCVDSIIIIEKKNEKLITNTNVNRNAILVLDQKPYKIEHFLDLVNTHLIKKKYNNQSKINIKNYTLNFNSRIISNEKNELKLTEKEIDIILFLNNNRAPQSIHVLQHKVWGYSVDLETHTVETHVYRLRKKIKDEFNDDTFIVSHNNGYLI
ncbi:winged helix-turn-helix domain-containing protein [Candidatus Pelagibacter sp.]|jgi:DNA-binding response OmpR family regulator|nr:winged helix-turn-helix domain-containing protein [Candidatus Pelagibacter sp.]